MRSVEEIKAQIAKVESDDRYQSGLKHPATVDINAPLALIQLSFETQLKTLKWVLNE